MVDRHRDYDDILNYLERDSAHYDMRALQMATTFEEAQDILRSNATGDLQSGRNAAGILTYAESGNGQNHLKNYWDDYAGERRRETVELFDIGGAESQLESFSPQEQARALRAEGFSESAIRNIQAVF